MRILTHSLAAAIAALAIGSALPAQAQTFIQSGAHGSVTLTVLGGATSLAGGVLRVSGREVREDEDYIREAVLFQIPPFDSTPAAFTAPFAFTPTSRTRILLINSDDTNSITVRAAFYDRGGHAIGCQDIPLDPHERKSRKVHEIPLTTCP